jgi:hypothetical protein
VVLFETRYRRSKWKEVAAINHDIIGAEKKIARKECMEPWTFDQQSSTLLQVVKRADDELALWEARKQRAERCNTTRKPCFAVCLRRTVKL